MDNVQISWRAEREASERRISKGSWDDPVAGSERNAAQKQATRGKISAFLWQLNAQATKRQPVGRRVLVFAFTDKFM